jgi:hypothetical protein
MQAKYSFTYIGVAILTKQYYTIRISCSLFSSTSIMFDEASDINMNANLNVFVNVLLACGNVKTLTLSLVGSILVHAHIILITCSCCILLQHFRFQHCITIIRIELEAKDAGNVYRVLLDVLMEYCVPLERIIGICSDGASTMMGCYRGVCTKLAQHVRELRADTMLRITGNGSDIRRAPETYHHMRGVYVIHCVCHRLALILSDAINGTAAFDPVIPEGVVRLLNTSMLHAYFSKSAKRKYTLRMLILINDKNKTILEAREKTQEEGRRRPALRNTVRNPHDDLEAVLSVLGEERHKLPRRRIVLTRWLSSADAVRGVLTSRETYALFFLTKHQIKQTPLESYSKTTAL